MAFINIPQEWENVGVKPTEEIKKDGFKPGYKPPAAYFNYLFNNYYNCIKELQDAFGESGPDGFAKIQHTEKTIPASGWTATADGFKYEIDTEDTAVQMGNVYFSNVSLPSAVDAGILPVTSCEDGILTIYATAVPEMDLTATVELIKGGW